MRIDDPRVSICEQWQYASSNDRPAKSGFVLSEQWQYASSTFHIKVLYISEQWRYASSTFQVEGLYFSDQWQYASSCPVILCTLMFQVSGGCAQVAVCHVQMGLK